MSDDRRTFLRNHDTTVRISERRHPAAPSSLERVTRLTR